ncbi:MAG: glutamate--tRNA ligase [Candidatus Moraniibacteriota bacterium]
MNTDTKIRVRFAPSPTGYLHVGSLRSALYNYLFARKNKGVFILKIEDTDRKRFVEGAVESLIGSLDWMGLKRDEGVFQSVEVKDDSEIVISSENYPGVLEVGKFGPYIQSEKLEIYKKYVEQLVEKGLAYYCFCGSERLEKMREEQISQKKPPMYDRHCLNKLSDKEIMEKLKNNEPYVIRLKVPKDRLIEFSDIVRGKISINTNTIDDQVLMKSDGFPTYHLANIIDDHEMQITHVIRGEEWLPSTPKHILLYEAFGWTAPEFAHLPLLLSTDKKKLSKRMGDVAVEDYIKNGYLKEAIINFVALLGWNPGEGETQEIFSLEELVDKFEINKVHKAGAVFDLKKLDWLNAQYIKKLSLDELFAKALPFLERKDFYKDWDIKNKDWNNIEKEEYLKKILAVEQERLVKLSDVGEENKFFFVEGKDISISPDEMRWKENSNQDTANNLNKAKEVLESISEENWNLQNIEKLLLESAGDKRGDLLFPLRAALTGEKRSPSPFQVAWVLGKQEAIKRIGKALEQL